MSDRLRSVIWGYPQRPARFFAALFFFLSAVREAALIYMGPSLNAGVVQGAQGGGGEQWVFVGFSMICAGIFVRPRINGRLSLIDDKVCIDTGRGAANLTAVLLVGLQVFRPKAWASMDLTTLGRRCWHWLWPARAYLEPQLFDIEGVSTKDSPGGVDVIIVLKEREWVVAAGLNATEAQWLYKEISGIVIP